MHGNFLDLLALAYVAVSIVRGRKRGLFMELPSTISICVFAVTGTGLYRWADRAISQASMLTGQTTGVLSFIGFVVAAIVLVQKLKGRIRQWAEKRFAPEHQRLGGGIAGGVRAFVLVAVAMLVLAHWPLHGLTRTLAEGSLLGRGLIRFVLPVYSQTHHAL